MQQPYSPGDYRESILIDDRPRSYRLHLPPQYDGSTPWPLVLGFHGGASCAAAFEPYSGLSAKADEAGFIAVYPDGTGLREKLLYWNAGICCGPAMEQQIDDVKFVRFLLAEVMSRCNIDAGRVFATGMSNGAMMAYRLASEMAESFAAIAPVAGPMGLSIVAPSRPVSVIHFHGTRDEFTPYEGGQGKRSVTRTNHFSIPYTIEAWVRANGCPPQPRRESLPVPVDDGMTVERFCYGPGREGSEVVLYVIAEGGHTWPGRQQHAYFFGKSTENLSANDAMWEFFKRHGRNPSP